jgi:hypothetical protein
VFVSSHARKVPAEVLAHPAIVALIERATPVGSVTPEDIRQACTEADVPTKALKPFIGHLSELGITVDVPRDIPWGNKSLPDGSCTRANGYIEPGAAQHLDGFQALWFARSRCGADDYDRMARQRCLVTAMANQADIQTLLTVFPELLDVIRENVLTDIPLDMLPDLIPLWDVVDTATIVTIGFNPPDYLAGQSSEGHNLPEFERILETVQEAM